MHVALDCKYSIHICSYNTTKYEILCIHTVEKFEIRLGLQQLGANPKFLYDESFIDNAKFLECNYSAVVRNPGYFEGAISAPFGLVRYNCS